MIKIKAHSGDRLNDLADQLAKKAVQDGPRLNLKLTDILAVRILMTCDDLEIEASSRRCIKHLFHAQNFSQFLLLRRAKEIYMLTEQHHIQWSATTRMLNNNQTDNDRSTTSFMQHHRRAFKYKLFISELLTLTQLNKRRPDLYKKPTCVLCNQKDESQEHIWTCSVHHHIWINLLSKAAHFLYDTIQHISDTPPHIDTIMKLVHESRTFITKGLVSTTFWSSLIKFVRSE